MSFWQSLKEKLNPAQPSIAWEEGITGSTQTKLVTVQSSYELVEVVNRSVNMIVDSSAQVGFDVADSLSFTPIMRGMRKVTLNNLLNHRPNPYMDKSTFRRLLYMDFLIDGNAFIYYDGSALYHIPAKSMEVIPDEKTYVNHYLYDSTVEFSVNEIIHIKDNSARNIYRGDSRINSALNTIISRQTMNTFQEKFFQNGAVVGLVVETDAVLSKKLKERQEKEWVQKFNPQQGSKKPLILDAGMKVKNTNNNSFKDMTFNDSIVELEKRITSALGVPPLLLDSGNNANIRPNLELFFSMTIIPLVRKFESAIEFAFGYDIDLTTHNISALRPDQKAESERLSSLVNNGIMIGNEAREILRLEEIDDPKMNTIRIPANIAGSATGVSGQEGGKPPAGE